MITDNLEDFAKPRIQKLVDLGIKLDGLELDHFGYQTTSSADYEFLRDEFKTTGDLQNESIVGGRRVAIFKLKSPIQLLGYIMTACELIEPKTGQVCESKMDHVEFVLDKSFQDFVAEYPQIEWDLSIINREEYPKVTYRFPDGTSVRFHLKNILNEF